MYGDDVQPVEKVLAETAGAYLRSQVPAGRSHDADVDGHVRLDPTGSNCFSWSTRRSLT